MYNYLYQLQISLYTFNVFMHNNKSRVVLIPIDHFVIYSFILLIHKFPSIYILLILFLTINRPTYKQMTVFSIIHRHVTAAMEMTVPVPLDKIFVVLPLVSLH